MADCTLFLVKIFRKPSEVRKNCKGFSYTTLKVLSNKAKLIFIAISFKIKRNWRGKELPRLFFDYTNFFHSSDVAGNNEWQCLISAMLQVCYDVTDVVSPVVTNSSPEGNICDNGKFCIYNRDNFRSRTRTSKTT